MIADRGYGSGDNLEFLENRGTRSNIPLWSTRSGETKRLAAVAAWLITSIIIELIKTLVGDQFSRKNQLSAAA